jgi:DNA-binding LacI/PurR family transcriptional regulator
VTDPIYKRVSESLLRDIQNGKYGPGQKLPSETALVQRFGTSRITVGRALRELKQRGLVTGVAGSGNFVKAVAAAEGHLFGLLIPNLGETEIFEPICQGMAASQSLLWGNTAGNQTGLEQQALQLCHQYIARGVSGVFFAPLELTPRKDAVNLEICSLLSAARIPVVLLDRCIMPFPHRSKYDLVGIDNRRAGYLAAEHLLDLRCRSVAFLALSGAAPTIEARIAGYREALFTRGMEFAPHRVERLSTVTPASVRQALKSTRSHAFVCANDRLAGQFMQAVQELGHRVPQEIRVVGIDDVEYARMLPVPLTTIHQPCRAIGEMAVTAMLTRMEKPDMVARDILLDCRLVVRKSSIANEKAS